MRGNGNSMGECAAGPSRPDWCELLGEALNVTRWSL
jgi:hypothetical protein